MPESDPATQIALIHRELKSIAETMDSIQRKTASIDSVSRDVLQQKNALDGLERRATALERDAEVTRTQITSMQTDFSSRIQSIRDELREHRYTGQVAILARMDEMLKAFDTRFEEKEARIRALEEWRWWLLGIMAAASLALSGIPWKLIVAS